MRVEEKVVPQDGIIASNFNKDNEKETTTTRTRSDVLQLCGRIHGTGGAQEETDMENGELSTYMMDIPEKSEKKTWSTGGLDISGGTTTTSTASMTTATTIFFDCYYFYENQWQWLQAVPQGNVEIHKSIQNSLQNHVNVHGHVPGTCCANAKATAKANTKAYTTPSN